MSNRNCNRGWNRGRHRGRGRWVLSVLLRASLDFKVPEDRSRAKADSSGCSNSIVSIWHGFGWSSRKSVSDSRGLGERYKCKSSRKGANEAQITWTSIGDVDREFVVFSYVEYSREGWFPDQVFHSSGVSTTSSENLKAGIKAKDTITDTSWTTIVAFTIRVIKAATNMRVNNCSISITVPRSVG